MKEKEGKRPKRETTVYSLPIDPSIYYLQNISSRLTMLAMFAGLPLILKMVSYSISHSMRKYLPKGHLHLPTQHHLRALTKVFNLLLLPYNEVLKPQNTEQCAVLICLRTTRHAAYIILVLKSCSHAVFQRPPIINQLPVVEHVSMTKYLRSSRRTFFIWIKFTFI